MNDINVHCSWDPLEEIWLGDVWPKEFYEDLQPDVRDAFNKITDWTKEDLYTIQYKFEQFKVKVKRPEIDINNKDKYINKSIKKLVKPPICLRDDNAVVGNTLFFKDTIYSNLISDYNSNNLFKEQQAMISGASLVKIGNDILFDSPIMERQPKEFIFYNFYNFEKHLLPFFKSDYRIYYATNGGHCDGCFMPIKFGLSLSTVYASGYDFFLPEWQTVDFAKPSFVNHAPISNGGNGRWFVPELNIGPHFNQYVEKFCPTWIGEYKETFFEVNVVSIDEENILCIGDEKNAQPFVKEIEKYGIKCHLVPFRTRSFWDGGLHCITLDTRRRGTLKDFFPERGDYGLKEVVSSHFSSHEQFMDEYNQWKSKKNL